MMFRRLCAIALFFMISGVFTPVSAGEFAERFEIKSPYEAPALTFLDGKGATRDLREYRGRYVLLNLWATWCAPCVHEMPSLNALPKLFSPKDMVVVAISEDRDGIAAAGAFYKRHSLKNLDIYVDGSGRIPFLLQAAALPLTLLIDPKGMVVGRIEGGVDWTSDEAVNYLRTKMKAGS